MQEDDGSESWREESGVFTRGNANFFFFFTQVMDEYLAHLSGTCASVKREHFTIDDNDCLYQRTFFNVVRHSDNLSL